MKEFILTTATAIFIGLFFASCSFGLSSGAIYKDSGKYSAGSFAYDSEKIDKVAVNWVYGSVKVVCGGGELSVELKPQMWIFLRQAETEILILSASRRLNPSQQAATLQLFLTAAARLSS